MRRWYKIGTEVQSKHGNVRKKIGHSKWTPRARYAYMRAHKRKLDQFDRVFHIDGDRANDNPKNLVAIRFSGNRYSLKRSRVIWEPKR